MRYQTSLEAIDEHGTFLGAIHFGHFPAGGEDTRETAFAHFSTGKIGKLDLRVDAGSACTLARPASQQEQVCHQEAAAAQERLSTDMERGPASREQYTNNGAHSRHSARLAGEDTVWIPRHVLANQSGMCLLGFDLRSPVWDETLQARLRLVDLTCGSVLLDESSFQFSPAPNLDELYKLLQMLEAEAAQNVSSHAQAQVDELQTILARLEREASERDAREFLRRHNLLPRALAAPCALAADGSSALFMDSAPGHMQLQERALQLNLQEIASIPIEGRFGCAMGVADGWLIVSDKSVCLYGYRDGNLRIRRALPKSASAWGTHASRNGRLIVLPCDASFVTLDLDTGTVRKFHPHRGVRRDASVTVRVSECGEWVASAAEERLSITRLSSGVSYDGGDFCTASVATPSHDNFIVRSHVTPGMAFVSGRLIIADKNGLREHVPQESAGQGYLSEQTAGKARNPQGRKRKGSIRYILEQALGAAAGQVIPHLSPAARIQSQPFRKKGWQVEFGRNAPPIGASRLGGWPDLPAGMPWPTWQERPMAFLAQINLAEAHAAVPGLRLPGNGLLSFFLGCTSDTYAKGDDPRQRLMADIMIGTEPDNRGGWRVVFTQEPINLRRQTHDAVPLPQLFDPCSINFSPGGVVLPDESTIAYETLTLDSGARDAYNGALSDLAPPAGKAWTNQLMGYPNLIQGTPPEWMCELASRGNSPWLPVAQDDPAFQSIQHGAAEWGLLLQLTSDSNADFLWGDGGHFYFYGNRLAMERGDFSNVWVNYEN